MIILSSSFTSICINEPKKPKAFVVLHGSGYAGELKGESPNLGRRSLIKTKILFGFQIYVELTSELNENA